jgi:anti-sigma regulatory factor (Ser/Thr protein kinase)
MFNACEIGAGSVSRSGLVASNDGFRHEAFLYADDSEFLAGAAAFVRDAVVAGEPIMVVVDAAKVAALRTVLDGDAERVQLADMATVGRNPARIIPAWQAFVDQHSADGQRLRGISEPIRVGRSPEELVECRHHEGLLNEAFVDTAGFWLLCAYDTAALGPVVIDQAHGTHRFIARAGQSHLSRHYHGAEATRLFEEPVPEPPAGTVVYEFGAADLASVRRLAVQHAVTAGLADRAADVALVAGELATNSVRHGGGGGTLRLWRQHAALICEVRDRGHVVDPLVGRRCPVDGQVGGRGLWVVNQVCDLVQMRSSPSGTTLRAHIYPNDS